MLAATCKVGRIIDIAVVPGTWSASKAAAAGQQAGRQTGGHTLAARHCQSLPAGAANVGSHLAGTGQMGIRGVLPPAGVPVSCTGEC